MEVFVWQYWCYLSMGSLKGYVPVLGVFSTVSAAASAKKVFEVTMAAYY